MALKNRSTRFFEQHALVVGYADSFFDRLVLKLWVGTVCQNDGFEASIGVLGEIRITGRIDKQWLIAARVEANHVGSGYQYLYATISTIYDF